MRKKNRCYLCGGKLKDGYCPDCGLDNTRIERAHYHLNESYAVERVNGLEESPAKKCKSTQKQKWKEKTFQTMKGAGVNRARQNTYRFSGSTEAGTVMRSPKRTGHFAGRLKSVIGVLVVVVMLGKVVMTAYESYQEDHSSSYVPEEEYYDDYDSSEYDPYEYAERELSETGDSFETIVEPGEYIVGVHIPEGTYTIHWVEGSGSLNVDDYENSVYLWDSFGTHEEYDEVQIMEDVRLYEGARVSVNSGVLLQFVSENAQITKMDAEKTENPLTESVKLSSEKTYTAGTDFPAGVYDAEIESGWASVEYLVPTDNEYAEDGVYSNYLWLDEEESNGVYRNLVLPEGTKITVENAEILLVPSDIIGNIDYSTYYE